MAVRHVRDLIAWEKGIDLVASVYDLTRAWPRDERFGLTSQIRRAVVSVPSNIAEGQGRFSTREFLHHLSIAHGSLMEVFTQITVANRLKYLDDAASDRVMGLIEEEAKIIHGLANSLRAKEPRKWQGDR